MGIKMRVIANLVSVVFHIRYYEAGAGFFQTVMQAARQELLRASVGFYFPFDYAKLIADGFDLADHRSEIPPPKLLLQQFSSILIQFIQVPDHAQFVPLHVPQAYILVAHREWK